MLLEWRDAGFTQFTGKYPQPDELVVPSRLQAMRSVYMNRENVLKDLKRLGLRHRRTHDARRTFITLARVNGARKDVQEQITHRARGNILDLYTTLPWPTLCEAVQCLKIKQLTKGECAQKMAEIARANLLERTAESGGETNPPSTGEEDVFVKEFVKGLNKKAAFVQKSWKKGGFLPNPKNDPNEMISELSGRRGGANSGSVAGNRSA